MVKLTWIARISDGMPLAASMDDEPEDKEYRETARNLVKSVAKSDETRCTVDAGPFVFHYMIEMGVCYMVLADKTYPKRLAFAYLAELQKEFQEKHGAEVPTALRPYSFARFDNFIQKAKRQYKDSRAQWNLDKLNNDLEDVHRIMTRNIQDVLGRGEALSQMSSFSEKLVNESRKFHKDTKNLNWAALYQKYGPPGIVLLVVFLVFYVRYYWF